MTFFLFLVWLGGAVCNPDLKIGFWWRMFWPTILGASILRDLRRRKDYWQMIDEEEPKP
jgi:hypothetical protein